jgi:hypothetical protein
VIGIAAFIRCLPERKSPQGIESKDRGIRKPTRVKDNEDWYKLPPERQTRRE